jgi:hypothetical protein
MNQTINQLAASLRNGTNFWDVLISAKKSYGISALTTYWSNRELHNMPAAKALQIMRDQIKELGVAYPGGFECVKYRTAYRLNA